MSLIQINKFAKLADGKKIVFCKTDHLASAFDFISKLNNDVVLISGNSDYHVDDAMVESAPSNIKKWFCHNCLSKKEKMIPLPMGIENHECCVVEGHGVGHAHAVEKERMLSSAPTGEAKELLYANFSLYTNAPLRTRIKDMCIKSGHINWDEPTLPYQEFLDRAIAHQGVICPLGNGFGDNHRIYETLYLNRTPFVFYKDMYEILHHKMPVVFVEEEKNIMDEDWVRAQIDRVKSEPWDENIITYEYWEQRILEEASKI